MSRHVARRALALAAGLVFVVAAAGCTAKSNNNAAPPPFTTGLGSDSPSPASSSPATGPTTPAPPAFPTDAKAYGLAVLTAYSSNNNSRLAQLATSDMIAQFGGHGRLDSHWVAITCDDAAGSSHCTYRNMYGDQIVIQMTIELLGHPQAANDAQIETTVLSSDPVAYIGEMIGAWQEGNQQRMAALASSSIASSLGGQQPVQSYNTGTEGVSGHTIVHVYELPAGGREFTFKVVNQNLGKIHAIECVALGDSC
jgi:hypothetical protein